MSIHNIGNLIFRVQNCIPDSLTTEASQLLADNDTESWNCDFDHVTVPLDTSELIVDTQVKPEKYFQIYKKIRNVVQDQLEALLQENPELEFRRDGMWELGRIKVLRMKHSTESLVSPRMMDPPRRHLAFISFLTDSSNSTVKFKNQNVIVPCKRGDLIFFPPYWTHRREHLVPEGAGDVEILFGYVIFI